MDSFLKEIDTELLKRWLLNQNEDDWDVKEVNDNIKLTTITRPEPIKNKVNAL